LFRFTKYVSVLLFFFLHETKPCRAEHATDGSDSSARNFQSRLRCVPINSASDNCVPFETDSPPENVQYRRRHNNIIFVPSEQTATGDEAENVFSTGIADREKFPRKRPARELSKHREWRVGGVPGSQYSFNEKSYTQDFTNTFITMATTTGR